MKNLKRNLLSVIVVMMLTLTSFAQDMTIFTSEYTELNGVEVKNILNGSGSESIQIFSISFKDSVLVHILKGESQLYKIIDVEIGEDNGVPYIIFEALSGLSAKVYKYTIFKNFNEEGEEALHLFIGLTMSEDLIYGGRYKVNDWIGLKTFQQQ